jgi:NAD(P)H-dependent flavin oxidoreductase YrpB (nitropropane dioxygenase family)
MGTRFVASLEADFHADYKALLVDAEGGATVYTERFRELWPDAPHRVLRRSIAAAEAGEGPTVGTMSAGAERIDVPRFAGFAPVGDAEGEIEAMACFAGEGVGSIADIRPAGEIVTEFSTEAAALLGSAVPYAPDRRIRNS